jgi:tRNA 2-thiouridine synthesizing protein E
MTAHLKLSDGRDLELDSYGHLVDAAEWTREAAIALSGIDGIELNEAHWLVISLMQGYYKEFGIEAPMRLLVMELRAAGLEAHASSLGLYRLFPEGPARQASRYGGLPIPVSCI